MSNKMLKNIESVLNKEVRPYLQSHGGDVRVCSYNDGIVRVQMLGGCASCIAAAETNDQLISTALKDAIPAVKDVLLVDDISPELLNLAKAILNKEPLP